MNINISTPNFHGKLPVRNLVPASQLKGLKLQLTEAEMSQVQEMEKYILDLTTNIKQTQQKSYTRKYSPAYKLQIKNEIANQKKKINSLQEKIRNIKVNRFTEQKRAAGLDVNV